MDKVSILKIRTTILSLFLAVILLLTSSPVYPGDSSAPVSYPWTKGREIKDRIKTRINTPPGYERVKPEPGSFGRWLQRLPLKEKNAPVLFFDGRKKPDQNFHYAVIDIDSGSRDLQQCADAVIRLRAEYLYCMGKYDRISFHFTSGDEARFLKWAGGYRPYVDGSSVTWKKTAEINQDYPDFRKYLDAVFTYAGSWSLSQELLQRKNPLEMKIGDVLIQGGFPGHAVIIVDKAVNPQNNDILFLAAQSYMPAQDIHILKNPGDKSLSPWYKLPTRGDIVTPEWTFQVSDLRYFP